VDLSAAEDGTTVEIRHEHIPTYFDASAITHKWEQALEKLAAAAG
jgi:hypothetical protein